MSAFRLPDASYSSTVTTDVCLVVLGDTTIVYLALVTKALPLLWHLSELPDSSSGPQLLSPGRCLLFRDKGRQGKAEGLQGLVKGTGHLRPRLYADLGGPRQGPSEATTRSNTSTSLVVSVHQGQNVNWPGSGEGRPRGVHIWRHP